MSTTSTLERIDMVRGSKSYKDTFGKPPRHLSDQVEVERPFTLADLKREPRHRKPDSRPKHRLWDIEQH